MLNLRSEVGAWKQSYSSKSDSVFDSGSSFHIVNDLSFFTSYEMLQTPIQFTTADNKTTAEGMARGTVNVISRSEVNGEILEQPLTLENAYYVSSSPHCLFSSANLAMSDQGIITVAAKGKLKIYSTHPTELLACGTYVQGVTVLDFIPNPL